MPVKVKIDFYTVATPSGSDPFHKMIKDDSKTNDDESRNEDIRGFPVRLQQAHFGSDFVEADMLKIQMSDLPPKAKLSGAVTNLGLDDDEGIGGETAFLYNPETKVLVIQRNRSGVSARMVCEYFEKKLNLSGPITLAPIIQGDAIQRLAKMKEMRHLKIKLASVTNPNFFRHQGKGLAELIDVLEFFRSPSCSFEMSMGHESGSLWSQRVLALGRQVISSMTLSRDGNEGDVTTMEVSGILDDDSRDEFDVLMYRMIEVVTVKENEHRRSTYKKRRPEILQAWRRREAELKSMFGS